ncbi:PRY domain containing protein [Scophthalmus maximus]|uniref:PRY domain containing protein n=1 Tax=Scophthalmus maximus TaxID=52904 RepID=A0A2U9CII2_SCOMX|nr:PRY domain containing protein [Scophthalmus maximus]
MFESNRRSARQTSEGPEGPEGPERVQRGSGEGPEGPERVRHITRVQAAAASSCPGRLSLKSNASMGLPENFRGAEVPASEGVQPAAAAASSCPGRLSLKSDASMGLPENFRGAEVPAGEGLNDCRLTANCCESLSSAVSSASSDLCDLNLSDNSLHDAGVELLCTGLQSPHCRLKTLTLNRCGLTQRSCVGLASVLSSPSSHLQELDLSDNDIEDSGVQLLCAGLRNVSCKLEILRLSFCSVTEKGCVFLASAVKSNPSHLRELDLSYNHLGESGVPLVSEALEEGGCEFTKLRVDHNEECWLKPGLSKYACELTVDLNTAHKLLIISDGNRRVTQGREEQPYPDHPDRFDYWTQVLFQQGLTGRCYWEVEWEGNWAGIGVTYRGIGRKGVANDCVMGYNGVSWGLHCSAHGYAAYHNIKSIAVSVPSSGCHRVAVYLDWEAGVLSFYRVSSGRSLTHLHTFYTTFTEPLHPGFRVWDYGSSVALSPPL